MKVTFIGLGIMGSRMASNLLKSGVDLTVFNRTEGPTEILKSNGAKTAVSIIEAVKQSDVVFTMLSDPGTVKTVITDEVLEEMKEGALWVDCSTVNPTFSRECANRANANDVRFIDAPVAGSKSQAENTQLVFLVGGNKNEVGVIEPLLNAMGNKILHIGEIGMGASFKMIVNMLLANNMIAFSEAMLLGQKMGIEKDFLLDVVPKLPVAAPFTQFKAENIRNDEWEEQFPLELMHKDLRLASDTGSENDLSLPLTELSKTLYKEAEDAGMARLDMSAIYKFLEER